MDFLPYKLFYLELERNNIYRKYIQYEKALCKIVKNTARIMFLEQCKRNDVIPKFLKFRVPNNGCFNEKMVHEFQKRLLHQEIVKAKGDRKELSVNSDNKRALLKASAPFYLKPSIVWYYRHKIEEVKLATETTHTNKLASLAEQQDKPLLGISNTVKILAPDINPPKYVLDTLAMGPKSSVLGHFDPKDILVELDRLLIQSEKQYLPQEIINDINIKTLNYVKHCEKMKPNRHIQMTRKYLTSKGLIAVPFDKGIGLCVLTIDQYKEKMDTITSLPQFKRTMVTRKGGRPLILIEEERVDKALSALLETNRISIGLYNQMKPHGSQPPRLYGLAKVHKENIPMRPVLSMPGSPYHKIGNCLKMFLSKVPECMIRVSSSDISNHLKDIHIKDNEELVSFDVTSLYTNVPVKESIGICADLLYSKFSLPFQKDTFIELAMLASSNVLMLTHDGYFIQTEGLAMGSSLAPYLANGWLNTYDSTIAMVPMHPPDSDTHNEETSSGEEIHPREDDARVTSSLYARYMDDIITIVPRDEAENKLFEINNLHPALHFTMEREHNGTIPFLDMLLFHQETSVSSTWYTKPTDTGLMMNYHALAPVKYKKSIVVGLVHRVYRACSSYENIDLSLQKAKVLLLKNQYPPHFFEPLIYETLTNIIAPDSKENKADDEDKDPFLFFLQYRGKCSDEFARNLKRLLCNDEAAFRLQTKVIFTLKKLKTALPPLKEPVPSLLKSGVVYQLECPSCKAGYVGETLRHLTHRFREHRINEGPLRRHLKNCNTDLQIDNVKILATASNQEKLMTLEALFIRDLKPSLNTKDEFKSRKLRIKF